MACFIDLALTVQIIDIFTLQGLVVAAVITAWKIYNGGKGNRIGQLAKAGGVSKISQNIGFMSAHVWQKFWRARRCCLSFFSVFL